MSDTIAVTVGDGPSFDLRRGAAASEALGKSANGKVVAARADGTLIDLSSPLQSDCTLEPVGVDTKAGLEVLRHSCAHLLAQAVKRLYPNAQVTIGPVIEDGFYYDFYYPPGFTPEDLERITVEMGKIIDEDLAVSREVVSKAAAVDLFRSMGEDYKVEIVDAIDDDSVSLYRQGEFVDLCRGPHVPATGRIKAFKLTSVAGAYWRGDEHNAMLQRIYGTAFADPKALKQHLARIEEAKKRDHRKLGAELGLFSFHKEAPASPFFHPDGAILYNLLIGYIRDLYARFGYQEVITPQILDVDLWHRSGHYENYKENMYFTEVEGRSFAVKPMNCPTHCLMYGETIHSYRDLPIRYADFGRLHRFERSGVVHGLTRVRSFSQDDAHIFCTPEQIGAEIAAVIEMILTAYAAFGFEETRIYLSTRPDKSIGSDAVWQRAEAMLEQALERSQRPFEVNPGDGAFYGPKIDFCVLDAMKREWQLSTVQLDFALPERFELEFVDNSGSPQRPVMIHRAILGSLERFFAILVEHTAGAFPLWLAPCQVRLVTVTDKQNDYAGRVEQKLRRQGIRARADRRNEKLGFKIREAQRAKIPVVAVIGEREVEDGTVSPRLRDGSQPGPLAVEDFAGWLSEKTTAGNGGVP